MCDPDLNSSDQCQGHINIGMVSVGHTAWFLETCWRACCRAFVGMSCVSTVFILIQYNQNRKILAYDLLVNFLESACVKSWTRKVTLLSLTFSPRQKATGWPCSSKTGWPSLTRPSFPSKRRRSVIQTYRVGHFEASWEARLRAKAVFQAVWGTEKLLSSVDGIAIAKPPQNGTQTILNTQL